MQVKSHEVLIKILNNVGVIGAILAGLADLIIVIVFVLGIKIDIKQTSIIIFASINSMAGLLINILLRFQGQKYAEIENKDLCDLFYRKKAEKNKKHISMGAWQLIMVIKDIVFKGFTTAFSIFGIIYISIEGSKNPIQILITVITLILFTCFGFISMDSSYSRFYNIQVPYMELKVKEKELLKKELI